MYTGLCGERSVRLTAAQEREAIKSLTTQFHNSYFYIGKIKGTRDLVEKLILAK